MFRFKEIKETRKNELTAEQKRRLEELDRPISESIEINREIIQKQIDKCGNTISFIEFEERLAELDKPMF